MAHPLIMLISLLISTFTLPEPAIRVYVFQRGQLITKDASIISAGVNKGKRLVMGNTCFLIRHPKGTLLWDTGLPDSLVAYPNGKQEGPALLVLKQTLTDQLAGVGITPSQVNYLALSHGHTDHAGNANLFQRAVVLMQRDEYKRAFGPDAKQYFYNPAFYNKLTNFRQLEGNHDVFGDGRVVIMKAPGHTPGHQVLFPDLAQTGPVLVSGDLYHHQFNRRIQGMPAYNFSRPQTLQSMKRMEAFITRKRAKLWIQHDSTFSATARLAPAFYD